MANDTLWEQKLECDLNCGEFIAINSHSKSNGIWNRLLLIAKDLGWTTVGSNKRTNVMHICPDCTRKAVLIAEGRSTGFQK